MTSCSVVSRHVYANLPEAIRRAYNARRRPNRGDRPDYRATWLYRQSQAPRLPCDNQRSVLEMISNRLRLPGSLLAWRPANDQRGGDMNTAEQSIKRVVDGYVAAVLVKDVDAFVALYDSDAQVFDMWGEWAYRGAGDWRAMATEWFGSLGTDRVAVEMDDVRAVESDDLAVVHAFVTYKGLSAEGEQLRAMTNRLTWALRRQPGSEWKIIHEHSSAPADFETSKVILKR
jgi:uncharacterized protein (TIGR02246 family)